MASSEQGEAGARCASTPASPAAPARRRARAGPTSSGGTTSCPRARSPAAPRARRACRTRSARTAPMSPTPSARRASARRRRRAVADACAVFAVSDELGARLDAVAGPLGDRLHVVSAGRRHSTRSPTATARSRSPRSAGTSTGRASLTSATSSRPRTCNACWRRSPSRARPGAAARWRSSATARSAPSSSTSPPSSASPEACASPAPCLPAEVPRWLRACDVACLVSQREGFGLAAIEALACARPVVVSRGVPAASAVSEGVTGALCDAGDVDGHRRRARARRAPDPGRERAGSRRALRAGARDRARGRRAGELPTKLR